MTRSIHHTKHNTTVVQQPHTLYLHLLGCILHYMQGTIITDEDVSQHAAHWSHRQSHAEHLAAVALCKMQQDSAGSAEMRKPSQHAITSEDYCNCGSKGYCASNTIVTCSIAQKEVQHFLQRPPKYLGRSTVGHRSDVCAPTFWNPDLRSAKLLLPSASSSQRLLRGNLLRLP